MAAWNIKKPLSASRSKILGELMLGPRTLRQLSDKFWPESNGMIAKRWLNSLVADDFATGRPAPEGELYSITVIGRVVLEISKILES